ncbi:RIMS-binding protein 2 [Caerostris extrusa]|uniref:RIMS-binding protein 2 n=1 Tax=Caerostris extrusa TaxID=172846 RepID=A0AAV4Q5D4_CAEEX|nr:RIMS-binding protein 2 [Caerostris extrusa]
MFGLSPNTLYRVSVRVKPGKLLYNDEKNPKKLEMLVSNVEFRTLPKGLPEPPVNVQVEQGPQDGTLLVTWMPVHTTIVSTSVSPVIGYGVFAAGRQIAEVESPTDYGRPYEKLENFNQSAILRGRQFDERTPRERRSSSSDSESDTELTELLNHVNRRARAFDPLIHPSHHPRYNSSTKPSRMLLLLCRCCVKPIDQKLCGDVLEDMQIEGRSELSDIVEEEEETPTDTGENKSKMLCKVESINEADDFQINEIEKHRTDTQEHQSKPTHTVRRPNPNPQYLKHRTHVAEGNIATSGQIVLEPDENLSDKEIYPPSRINIPSIEITKDGGREDECEHAYSDDEYLPRERPPSPERFALSSSQQRPLRTEAVDTHHTSNSRSHRGPQSHYSQQHPHRDRSSPRRQSHDSALNRNQLPPTSNQPVSGRQRPPDQSRKSARNHSPAKVPSRSGNQPIPPDRGTNHSYYSKRRSSDSGRDASQPSGRRASGFYEPESRYENQGNYDSYGSQGDVGDNRVRFFVALFDYDPQTMSPNPDAADEELPFQEGQMIKIHGDKDADGFYRGESNGRVGLVPGNMVSEVQVDVDSGHYDDNSTRPRSLETAIVDQRSIEYHPRRVKKMVAMYDYDPQEISPNVDAENFRSVLRCHLCSGRRRRRWILHGRTEWSKRSSSVKFLREVQMDEEVKRHTGGRPKGQGRSYLGQAGCQWNGHHEKTTHTPKAQQRQRNMVEGTDGPPRNRITHPTQDMMELQHPQDTPRRQHYGMKEILNGTQHFEGHMYHQEDKGCLTSRHIQDHPQISIGNRPTYLHLQRGISSVSKNNDFASDEQRKSCTLNIMIKDDSSPKDGRKGIFSSFRDMFKGPKRN